MRRSDNSYLLNCLLDWLGSEVDHFHVAADLGWDFFQNLFAKVASRSCILERDKLDDITCARSALIILQSLPIAIKLIHA